MSDIDKYLSNVPIKTLVERIRKTQVWKRDLVNKKIRGDTTIDYWLEETAIAPGPHKVQARVLYGHYVDFCKGKKMSDQSIVSIKKLGHYIKQEQLFPKSEASSVTYYHLNKDVTPEAEREKQKAKKERKKQKKKAKESAALGIKTPDIQ